MNKSSIIFGIGGLLVGTLGTSLYYRTNTPTPASVAAVPSAPKNQKKVVASETSPKVEVAQTPSIQPTSETKQSSVTTTMDPANMAEVKKMMSEHANQRKTLKVNEQLAGLKKQLGLTDAQAEELRPLVTRMMASGQGLDIGELMLGMVKWSLRLKK